MYSHFGSYPARSLSFLSPYPTYVLEAARLQHYEPLDDRVKRDHLALRFSANVVTVAHIHRACIEFLLADDCERGAYMRISAEK